MSEQSFRQVALTLHGLHVRDRAWILGQLEAGVRAHVQALLAELKALGIQSTRETVEMIAFPTASHRFAEALADEIDAIDGEAAYAVFSDLPWRFRIAVLYARRWRWSAAVWLRLAEGDRRGLLKAMDSMANVRPAVLASTLEVFRTRVRQRRANSASILRA
jgi:hypothetical protein